MLIFVFAGLPFDTDDLAKDTALTGFVKLPPIHNK